MWLFAISFLVNRFNGISLVTWEQTRVRIYCSFGCKSRLISSVSREINVFDIVPQIIPNAAFYFLRNGLGTDLCPASCFNEGYNSSLCYHDDFWRPMTPNIWKLV